MDTKCGISGDDGSGHTPEAATAEHGTGRGSGALAGSCGGTYGGISIVGWSLPRKVRAAMAPGAGGPEAVAAHASAAALPPPPLAPLAAAS